MKMNSSERIKVALSHREADRVPYVLSASMHPAREMGISIKEYFSSPDNVVEGQLRLIKKFGNDVASCYPFAAFEIEAWGGDVIYFDDGPPNAGAPIIRKPEMILSIEPPDVRTNRVLQSVLRATAKLKEHVGDRTLVAGVIISPLSLPVMQMGFESYINLIYERPDLMEHLMKLNIGYCKEWANAQLEAGAATILYYDPLFSPTIMSDDIRHKYGITAAAELMVRINGSMLMHMASGRGLPIMEEIIEAGFAGMSASAEDDLRELKNRSIGKITLVGNLNALEMRHWSSSEAEKNVKRALAQAASGGGFILSDNHGEIPFLVDEEILLAVRDAVHKWGEYPMTWIEEFEL